ncbi:MAG TPA: nucleotidyltransferase [Candidatus Mediterraneibacter intestinipullorum]|nr:nucleotidyltransferase [Candidatus Mediterraneibacter intestinipullorum]
MKIVGLITEYNPFHNGHLHHIKEARRVTGADAVVVVMSGDYVQRGVPAIMPKRLRTEMALSCGASAVFELPVCYAAGSAEYFAMGAVSLLDSMGVVDSICFGSECNDLEALSHVADILSREPEDYRSLLKTNLKKGASFPSARHDALLEYTHVPAYAALLDDPNNILGIEYLKALKRLNSRMTPFTIRREGSHYHDQNLSSDSFSSASAIRSLLAYSGSTLRTERSGGTFENTAFSSILGDLENQVPSCCLELLKDYLRVQYPVYQNDFSIILKYKLLNKHPGSLVRYLDVSEDLANRICAQLDNFFNYKQFAELLKTRETTQTRINRALLHIMLGLKKDDMTEYMDSGYHFYARLLGYRKDRAKLISLIARESPLPLLAKLSDSEELPYAGQKMLRNDILASNLYMSVVTDKFRTAFQNEYKQGIVKI